MIPSSPSRVSTRPAGFGLPCGYPGIGSGRDHTLTNQTLPNACPLGFENPLRVGSAAHGGIAGLAL
jgi:hypothetical protein